VTLDVQAALTAPMLDHAGLDLGGAHRIVYRIEQRFRYTYDTPVTELSQRLVIVPRARHGDVVRRAHRVRVTGARNRRRIRDDESGNTVVSVTAARVEQRVQFDLVALLERVPGDRPDVLPLSILDDPRLRRPTRLTAADDRLRTMAGEVGRTAGPLELAERLCEAVHTALPYEFGVTNVATTAAQALAAGRGVCQDAAHIMVALCHLLGLPVRYVSGHLLGVGGTHAWVEVLVRRGDGAVAVPLDPCYGRPTHRGYVTVAVGRDYADVAPTSGTFMGSPGGELTCDRQVGVVNVVG
jgi:transglutaminase-like putative cysteine protease